MIDYKGLGMVGSAELWSGVDKLEAKLKWASFDAETLTMAASPFQTHSFQVRGQPRAVHQPGAFGRVTGRVSDDR